MGSGFTETSWELVVDLRPPRCSEMPKEWLRFTPLTAAFPFAVSWSSLFPIVSILCYLQCIQGPHSFLHAFYILVTQSLVCRGATLGSPGSLLEIQNLHFNKNPRLCIYILKIEKHWSIEWFFFVQFQLLYPVAQACGISLSNSQRRDSAQVSRPSNHELWGRGSAVVQNILPQAAGTAAGWGICPETEWLTSVRDWKTFLFTKWNLSCNSFTICKKKQTSRFSISQSFWSAGTNNQLT